MAHKIYIKALLFVKAYGIMQSLSDRQQTVGTYRDSPGYLAVEV